MEQKKMVENKAIKFWLEDGILYSEFKKPTQVDLKLLEEIIELRHKISNNENQHWCLDMNNFTFFSREAMNYAEIQGQEYLHAVAIIVRSHVARFILNTFVRLKKVVVPFQIFRNKQKAIEWLKTLKK